MATATTSGVGQVPSLDAIANNPQAAEKVPVEAAHELFSRAVRCSAVLFVRIVVAAGEMRATRTGMEEGDVWLSADEVVRRFGLSARWLAAHRRLLIGRRIISRPSRKTVVYHARRLARFLEERSLPPGS